MNMKLHVLFAEVNEQHIFDLLTWLCVLAVTVFVATYVVGKVRARWAKPELSTYELLSKFQILYSHGRLSEAEFRTIKKMLTAQIRDQGPGIRG